MPLSHIRYASLFSGLGGFEIALNNLSATCVCSSEIDKFAAKAYQLYFGVTPLGDIREVDEDDIPDHDLLVGGFPCQSFSVAGARLGFEDTRGTLFFEVARVAQRKKPKYLLLENVKGLLSHNKGDTIMTMLNVLSHIGYTLDFSVVNSKYWRPQHRERVFVVGVLGGKRERYKLNGESQLVDRLKKAINKSRRIRSFNFPWPKKSDVPARLTDVLETNVDEKYYLSDELVGHLLQVFRKQYQAAWNDAKEQDHRVACQLTRDEEPRINVLGLAKIRGIEIVRRVYDPMGLSPTLTTMDGGHREPKVLVERQLEARQELAVRKLTPLECFRLQGLPDDYHHLLREHRFSNRQLYKLSGNAVTVDVVSELARTLMTKF